MSKKHELTSRTCICCASEVIGESLLLHKTRRHTHALCLGCADGYIGPKLDQIIENLRKNIRLPDSNIPCCGTYHGLERNRCRLPVDVRKLKIQDLPSLQQRVETITLLMDDDTVFMCPHRECVGIVKIVDETLRAICPECTRTWCKNCMTAPFHDGLNCAEYEARAANTQNGKYLRDQMAKGRLKCCPRCLAPTV